jgi:hypothetical protein
LRSISNVRSSARNSRESLHVIDLSDLPITVDILLKLRDEADESFKVDFHVDFSSLELIARDVRIDL